MTTASQLHSHEIRDHILATGQRIMAGKGFSAVGLNEILTDAGVPKGSFYHYFSSKEAFGVAMLARYFDDYLTELDSTLAQPDLTMAQRLMNYWQLWRETQSFSDCQGKCLAVKLGAEVADLSDSMRVTLQNGTSRIIARLAEALEAGVKEGSLVIDDKPSLVAESLYQLWVGASIMVKIVRHTGPFDSAMSMTQKIIRITAQ
ncbi:TetR/AcrR family transcriptional regulator [Candidatus Pantoea floridensis]|uniref:Transcriptional regulator, TetR family n=1 Tax=Candidatus Pantoea floridensis TaxID=1938870 RepID=A0A286BZ83_9GAMM|nr:TetR/AcrR family transcriptional regulator [Pantoea floridensis]PIF21959.1 TetR family transcriptional regulator [Enterobacteriaceae bacterium JKS000233]SOD39469.1 transcriptional regulator, TetR family [Pantoea floridensis]